MASAVCSSAFRVDAIVLNCQWKPIISKNLQFWILPHSKRKLSFVIHQTSIYSAFKPDGSPNPPPKKPHPSQQLGYDPPEEFFGLPGDPQPRKLLSGPRSWFGPNGQYIRELPCPSCRGRGYTPCAECGIERPRVDCSLCNGKGLIACPQCLGDCVIWEESIDERPWEKARSVSPLKVKEDDEVDNLDINLNLRRKTKRVYHSPSPEVNLKISRSLKSLNEKTGLFSRRMKLIHSDPLLRAQRSAAIKKVKGTPAARRHASEAMKEYFRDPENRQRRSIAMKGVKFYCQNCGREGHRRNYCPEVQYELRNRQFTCRLCGEKGHNRRTCQKSKSGERKKLASKKHHCHICGQTGHNRRTCPQEKTAGVSLIPASKSSGVVPAVQGERTQHQDTPSSEENSRTR